MKKLFTSFLKQVKISDIFSVCILISILFIDGCIKNNESFTDSIKIEGVSEPIISLDGKWKFSMNPPKNYWANDIDFENWDNINVPGECAMQGFPIMHDIPYVYKTRIQIPSDYAQKVIKLKFDGVYSYSRVWINGNYIRDHKGGFTSWECDISNFIEAGTDAILTVEIIDKKNDLSYGSGYAKHQIGGILRSVWLIALPQNYLEKLYVETDLDENYKNAVLKIYAETRTSERAFIDFSLFDFYSQEIHLENNPIEINNSGKEISFHVDNPIKWDAEHPNLYKLGIKLFDENNNLTYSKMQNIGFREVEIKGNRMLVNGKPVKLRGACRHDMHPTLGRTTTTELDKMDVMLAKEANMNFIRTSHYPPSEAFLEYCNKYGIYVEVESAVCFVNTHRYLGYEKLKQSGPEFEEQYLSQVQEMVNCFRNEPSVIMWSIGNESKYDEYLQKTYDYIKTVDISRPVISSYPGLVPDSVKCYDILSMHYPGHTGNMGPQYGISIENFEYEKMPVLFDEWAHVACYNLPTLKTDPNVREFWGRSLDTMWIHLFESNGGLGGAIWGYIDETFMLPENMEGFNDWWGIQEIRAGEGVYQGPTVGYGAWGIIDTWRRKKPEFWNTKKAYTPVRILIRKINDFNEGREIKIPIYNRYDHTNLNEIKILWKYGKENGLVNNFNLEPHEIGELIIPANNWKNGEILKFEFMSLNGKLIDKYNILIGDKIKKSNSIIGRNFEKEEDELKIQFINKDFSIELNRNSGLLENLIVKKDTLLASGPYLNLLAFEKGDWATKPFRNLADKWKLISMNYSLDKGIISVHTIGIYNDTISAEFVINIDGNAKIKTNYIVKGTPEDKFIRESGISFKLNSVFSKMSWERNAYWSAYPDIHLGMPVGEVDLSANYEIKYREAPANIWEFDNKDFFYHGIEYKSILTNIARSTKENIYSFRLTSLNGSLLEVLADGNKACRLNEIELGYLLNINNKWDYGSLLWGNFQKNIKFDHEQAGEVILKVNL